MNNSDSEMMSVLGYAQPVLLATGPGLTVTGVPQPITAKSETLGPRH